MSRPMTIRILVTHADPLTQAGLCASLASHVDFEVLAPLHGDGDILVTDFACAVGVLSSGEAAHRAAPILVVTTSDRESDIRTALRLGVRGYVLQGCSLDELANAVRSVVRGGIHLESAISQRLAESVLGDALTHREEQVMRCVVEGVCNKEVARRLDLAVGTVKSHLRSVYGKLGVTSRTHAVAVAVRRGMLQSPTAPPGQAAAGMSSERRFDRRELERETV